jgi:hypothetical protein
MRRRPPPLSKERKIANFTRHKNIVVLRGYVRRAAALDDVGEVR